MLGHDLKAVADSVLKRLLEFIAPRTIDRIFFERLVRRTGNFGSVRWLGYPIWQNVLDLWTIQETIVEIRPELLIECGTNRGGSSLFFAHLFDLMNHGNVVTIDVARLHEHSHSRVEYLIGSSTDDDIVARVKDRVDQVSGPVMVILDSNHAADHVLRELELYAPFVSPNSFLLVQDGVIDTLEIFKSDRPGPLAATKRFLAHHPEFSVDTARGERFLLTHHPRGWLRKVV